MPFCPSPQSLVAYCPASRLSPARGQDIRRRTPAMSKRQRRKVTLSQKLDILAKYEKGERAVDISNALALPGSTVRSIIQNHNRIREFANMSQDLEASQCVLHTNRNASTIKAVEKRLTDWLLGQTIPATNQEIKEQAKILYNQLCPEHAKDSFKATTGWLIRFKRRLKFRGMPLFYDEDTVSTPEIKQEVILPDEAWPEEIAEDSSSLVPVANSESTPPSVVLPEIINETLSQTMTFPDPPSDDERPPTPPIYSSRKRNCREALEEMELKEHELRMKILRQKLINLEKQQEEHKLRMRFMKKEHEARMAALRKAAATS